MPQDRLAGFFVGAVVLLVVGMGSVPDAQAEPDPRYHDYDEVLAFFDAWAAGYPDIFHREIIGYTLVGNEPIWAAKISDNPSIHEPEARIVIHAAQHSNEANGTNAVIYMMDKLLTRYGHDTYYTRMVNDLELWFVPIVNVDGHRMVFAGGDNWDWWRKTKRDNNGDEQYTFPIDGVDANRNWDYRWDEYDQTDPESSRYKGPYPFSEPEVVAVRDMLLRERPVFLMDLHSPDIPSIGNKIWWPWYDPDHNSYGPDEDIYQPISQALGNYCETENDGVYVNGNGACYNRLPKEQCWIYKNTGTCVLLMEISLQFWWSGATVDTIAARTGRGLFYLMERTLTGPGLTGTITSAGSGSPLEAEVRVNQVHSSAIGPRMSEQFHGQYWRLLLPGSYTVTVMADGHYSDTQSIYVSGTGWTLLDFQLEPVPGSGFEQEDAAALRVLWADTPLGPGRSVHFRLNEEADISLKLLDVTGRHMMTLLEGSLTPGVRSIPVRRGLPSGAYLLLMRADQEQTVQKVILVE